MNKIKKKIGEWKNLLDNDTFNVTRNSGTEKPFTGKYLYNKSKGIYICICCGNKLFSSDTKYESGSGWPSFFQAINNKNIIEVKDNSHGLMRIEIICASCDSHLGHVFEDGPEPTGLRYCVNSLSLKFKKIE